MAWVNNNKRNARFNPNRKDDRLWEAQVTSRREHHVKPRKQEETDIELVTTDVSFVLSMSTETRLDWLQMSLMQAGGGKLKADALYKVLVDPAFGSGEAGPRKALRAMVLANLHLFSGKQKKAIEDAVGEWPTSDSREERKAKRRGRSRSRSSSSTRPRKRKDKDKEKDKDKDGGKKEKRKHEDGAASEAKPPRARSKSAKSKASKSKSRSRSKSRRRRR